MSEETPRRPTLDERVQQHLGTPYGRRRILTAMVAPLRLLIDYRRQCFDFSQPRRNLPSPQLAALETARGEDFVQESVVVRVFYDLTATMPAKEKADETYRETLQLIEEFRDVYVRSANAVPLYPQAIDNRLRVLWAEHRLEEDAVPPV